MSLKLKIKKCNDNIRMHYNNPHDPIGQEKKMVEIKPEKKTHYKDKNYFEVKEEPKKKMKSKSKK